jgi:hypothetical protein
MCNADKSRIEREDENVVLRADLSFWYFFVYYSDISSFPSFLLVAKIVPDGR